MHCGTPLIQMLRESVDVSVPKFFAWFKIRRAFKDGNHFVRQFVTWIFAGHISYFRQVVHR